MAVTYGDPPFYAQVFRDAARLNLRHLDTPRFDAALRDREQLLSASITLEDAEPLFLEYQAAGVEFAQPLKTEPWGARTFVVRDPNGNLILFAGHGAWRVEPIWGEETGVNPKQVRTTLAHPTPELPVEDVERAQQHYRDVFGFEIGWIYPGGDIGAVSRANAGAIFFRRRSRPFEPAVHWVFAPDIDATYEELGSRGARIVEPLETKPWGLRQFTVEDIDGNRFCFHHG